MSEQFFSIGLGVGTQNSKGEWLEVFYAKPVLNPGAALAAAVTASVDYQGGNQALSLDKGQLGTLESALTQAGESEQADIVKAFKSTAQPLVVTVLASDDNPASVPEGYPPIRVR